MERSYSGMNSAYYVGMESAFYCPPERFESSDLKEFLAGFDASPTSGSSSNTATQMTGMEDQREDIAQEMPVDPAQQAILDRPLPVRKRQRKPLKKTRAELEAESAPVVVRRKPGRKPKAAAGAVGRPKQYGTAVAAGLHASVMELERRLVAREPPPPALPRELPARHTPKKMWAEDEEDATPKRGRATSQARAESDYSPSASPVRRAKAPAQRPRQPQDGRPPAPKGQKEGGPCAVCFATKSATWRRGAQGGKHSGEPLCNKCGVWEFRHPDSPPRDEMDIERGGMSRRSSTISGVARRLYAQARALVQQPLSHEQGGALCSQPSTGDGAWESMAAQTDRVARAALRAPAVGAATTAVASVSRVQPWEGNNLVARVPVAAQNSTVQPLAYPTLTQAHSMPVDSPLSQASDIDAPTDTFSGAASMKRSGSAALAEPMPKRWQIEAYPGLESVSNSSSLWGIASAARKLQNGTGGTEGSEMAEDLRQLQHSGIKLKVKLSHAASPQKPEIMDESGDV